jgi:hypothetical protein
MSFEQAPAEARGVLPVRIRDLNLKIEGSPVEKWVEQLCRELAAKGLKHFRPACYLTDQWGCPSEEPVIGIPFYLADARLGAIENAVNDIENEREIMMYLRHEAGHAFNYAYELYKTPKWRRLFGPFRRLYRDEYNPVPFSKKFVRHIAGWYAQKHPDEDFAETFAVWLTPGSRWQSRYRDWPAMKKLEYVDRVAREVADVEPIRPLGEVDFTVDDMESTIEEFYRENTPTENEEFRDLPLDTDLSDIFHWSEGNDAAELVGRERKRLVDQITYWSGVRRSLINALLRSVEARLRELALRVEPEHDREALIALSVYLTSLVMNYLARGKFVHS